MKTTVKFGKLIEQFAILPAINICSMQASNKRLYDVQFAWLFWYVTIGKISSYVESYWEKREDTNN